MVQVLILYSVTLYRFCFHTSLWIFFPFRSDPFRFLLSSSISTTHCTLVVPFSVVFLLCFPNVFFFAFTFCCCFFSSLLFRVHFFAFFPSTLGVLCKTSRILISRPDSRYLKALQLHNTISMLFE